MGSLYRLKFFTPALRLRYGRSSVGAVRGLSVAVIGAGPAGLCAIRHLKRSPISAAVFERSADVGGTWLYSESSGKDEFGLEVHSTLYKDLRTNFPKQVMTFPDFPFPDDPDKSYVGWDVFLNYLNNYADHFNVRPHIKFNHYVKRVAPVGEGWQLRAEDLPNKKEHEYYFDAIMICSGPNSVAVYPKLEGMEQFTGLQMHSREFRTVDGFRSKTVLIIGVGPSGMDISLLLSKVADRVFLSHNKQKLSHIRNFPNNVVLKPDVRSLDRNEVCFADGTVEAVDTIIYCTGYTPHYPFLTEDCGIVVDQFVFPLYKHLININRPSMCIVGLPTHCPHIPMVDYQVRVFVKTLLGEVALPSAEEMMADLEADMEARKSERQRKKEYHKLWRAKTDNYFKQLSDIGQLQPIPPVQLKLFTEALIGTLKDFQHFRETDYRIIDEENYQVIDNTKENSSH